MKYMTFNNSCSYAGIANMLEDFSINVEDYQLAKEMLVPYIFKFDDIEKTYLSGSMLQEKKYFNYYLQKLDLTLIENKVHIEEIKTFLDKLNKKAMIGLKISEKNKHAVIFIGKNNNKYVFLNNTRKNSSETIYYKYDIDTLYGKLNSTSVISYIDKNSNNIKVNIKPEIIDSLKYLEQYKYDITSFCQKEQNVNFLKYTMNSMFKALFLDVNSMMYILHNTNLVNQIEQLRNNYLKAIYLNKPLTLSNYISIDKLIDIVNQYMSLIKEYIHEFNIKKLYT